MSGKNHTLIDGKLLRTDKQFRHLTQSQREKISEWLYQEYRSLWLEQKRLLFKKSDEVIISAVMEKILDADIWIPEREVLKYFQGKKNHYRKRMEKECQKYEKYDSMAEVQLSVETIRDAVAGEPDAVQ